MEKRTEITVKTMLNIPLKKAWACWTEPEHIIHWNTASDEWHCPAASNELYPGGRFSYRMEAKDGSIGFDFGGVYEQVEENALITYALGDGRKVRIVFIRDDESHTTITESFDADDVHPTDMQEAGWQAILDNYKIYAESV